ncbi:MAG: hypothetical protein QF418_06190 [Candidatus Marinimicrobia bacterium]|jgi:predicted RNase H-like nuclease (RuvC/YqgF family)|nr:hypothetical protein [Candidatus Neomarinimicrobiota bacterium]MDP6991542.1 hypothetical protein [Candidatus Neomarinimicrobiota bacterium]
MKENFTGCIEPTEHYCGKLKLNEKSSYQQTIEMLKDEIREYKRQIKVLKRTIENLKK